MFVTPFFAQVSNSLAFILLLALVISADLSSLLPQNIFIPPPVPVDSTIGVAIPFTVAPNSSAIAEENGYTVLDPTILILSSATTLEVSAKTAANAKTVFFINFSLIFLNVVF